MTIKLMLVTAALMLSASAQANNQPSQANHRANERIVDSYCDNGSCERVYERRDRDQMNASFGDDPSARPANFDRYIVRIERDRRARSVNRPALAISGR
jgi:hypothetical protein